MADLTASLVEQVQQARAEHRPLLIQGGGTKGFLANSSGGDSLDVTGHSGIVSYQPVELVLTARAGTPLKEIKAALAEKGQCLAFEPPGFGETATLGGTIATGLSGPARPYTGAARDYVLGVRMINGLGEALRFGGEVMKNVAGYDISRVMTGSHGSLGLLTEVSLKVLPVPTATQTVSFECTAQEAMDQFNAWAGQPLPITGTAWLDGRAYVRLAGAASAIEAAKQTITGDAEDNEFWTRLAEHQLPVFDTRPLWRVSVPQTASLSLEASVIEWGGAQRWVSTEAPADVVRAAAAAAGGHATLYRGDGAPVFQPLSSGLLALHKRIKASFDPDGLFNVGRFHPEF